MKKVVLSILLSLVVILPMNVKALSVEKNNIIMEKGTKNTVNLYTNTEQEIKEVTFTLVFTTYDVSANFNVNPIYLDTNPGGVTHTIVFETPVTGEINLGTIPINTATNAKVNTGLININAATATTVNDEKIQLKSQTITVTVGKLEKEEPKEEIKETSKEETKKEEEKKETPKDEKQTEEVKPNLLEKIDSKIVKIELIDGVYEYTVNIKKDIENLDLYPIVKDEKTKIDITTQKISEFKDNYIIIKAKNGDLEEEYKIKVNILEVEEIEIDNEEFEATYNYKGKWIILMVVLSITLVVGLMLNKKN